jgi:hypothetical protein
LKTLFTALLLIGLLAQSGFTRCWYYQKKIDISVKSLPGNKLQISQSSGYQTTNDDFKVCINMKDEWDLPCKWSFPLKGSAFPLIIPNVQPDDYRIYIKNTDKCHKSKKISYKHTKKTTPKFEWEHRILSDIGGLTQYYSPSHIDMPNNWVFSDYIELFDRSWVYNNELYVYGKFDPTSSFQGLYRVDDISGDPTGVKLVPVFSAPNVIGESIVEGNINQSGLVGVSISGKVTRLYLDGSVWKTEKTSWGNADPRSLNNDDGHIVGVTKKGKLFSLYGNFQFSRKDDVNCMKSKRPINLDNWGSVKRGRYCVDSNSKIQKSTWHSSGTEHDPIPYLNVKGSLYSDGKDGIYGVATNGKPFALWNNKSKGDRYLQTSTLSNVIIQEASYINDGTNGWGRGIFGVGNNDKLINLAWNQGSWKAKAFYVKVKVFDGYKSGFGDIKDYYMAALNGKIYVRDIDNYIWEVKYVGGTARYSTTKLN